MYVENRNDLESIVTATLEANKVIIIAVSGFCGSGKSTLGASLADKFNAPLVSIDEFAREGKGHVSDDWGTFDRVRLIKEVLKPAKDGTEVSYLSFDSGAYAAGLPGKEVAITISKLLVVEGVGIFTEQLSEYFDLTIWIDCPYDISLGRAKKRSVDTAHYFDSTWGPNDLRFFDKYRPDLAADVIYRYEQ